MKNKKNEKYNPHASSSIRTTPGKIALEAGSVIDTLDVERVRLDGIFELIHEQGADLGTHVSRLRGGSRIQQRHVGAWFLGHDVSLDHGSRGVERCHETGQFVPAALGATEHGSAGRELFNKLGDALIFWVVLATLDDGIEWESMGQEGQYF